MTSKAGSAPVRVPDPRYRVLERWADRKLASWEDRQALLAELDAVDLHRVGPPDIVFGPETSYHVVDGLESELADELDLRVGDVREVEAYRLLPPWTLAVGADVGAVDLPILFPTGGEAKAHAAEGRKIWEDHLADEAWDRVAGPEATAEDELDAVLDASPEPDGIDGSFLLDDEDDE